MWPKLNELDDNYVNTAFTLITQLIEEKCPELSSDRGVAGDLIAELHAILQGCSLQAIEKLRDSLSANTLAADPDRADPGIVDAVAGNFGVQRKFVTKAKGNLQVILTSCDGVNFDTGTVFVSDSGGRFAVCGQFCVCPPGVYRNRFSLSCQARGDGNYSVRLPVESVDFSPGTNLIRGSKLQPETPISCFVDAYAVEDFSGGNKIQTNAEMLSQARAGMASPSFSGIENIKAIVRNSCVPVDDLNDIVALPSPDAPGAKLHLYVRTRKRPVSMAVDCLAVRGEAVGNITHWHAELGSHVVPGCYGILEAEAHETNDICAIVDVKFVADPAKPLMPHIASNEEARFSAYQTARVTLQEVDAPACEFRHMRLTCLYMPGIAELQEYVCRPDVAQPGLSVLVRAAPPAPYFLDLTSTLTVFKSGDIVAMAAATDYIHSLALGQKPDTISLLKALPRGYSGVARQARKGLDYDHAAAAAFVLDKNLYI